MIETQARQKVRDLVRRGKLIKPDTCEMCHKKFKQRYLSGHHSDYTKPLDVVWLCLSCHIILHRKLLLENKSINPSFLFYNAKLNEDEVRLIRKMDKPYKVIAKLFGVGETTVKDIKRRVSWRHVQ